MLGKYSYLMIFSDKCSMCDDRIVYAANELIPFPDLMILIMKHGADACEIYETNGSYEIEDWTLISTTGNFEGFGIFK